MYGAAGMSGFMVLYMSQVKRGNLVTCWRISIYVDRLQQSLRSRMLGNETDMAIRIHELVPLEITVPSMRCRENMLRE